MGGRRPPILRVQNLLRGLLFRRRFAFRFRRTGCLAVEEQQLAIILGDLDFSPVVGYVLLVLPLARAQLTLDVNFRAFLKIFLYRGTKLFSKDNDTVPISVFLLFTGVVGPTFVCSDVESDDAFAFLRRAN